MGDKTGFSEGYIDGYQSIMSPGVVPSIPPQSNPGGRSDYQAGVEQGMKDALARKAEQATSV